MPVLSQIVIHPIKALDGVRVSEARILPGGSLGGDREFAMVDAEGRRVNGKRDERVHRLRAACDLTARMVSLRVEGQTPAGSSHHERFHLDSDRARLEAWLSDYFGFAVHLRQDTHHGFPDDPLYFGPTVVCTETLAEVASWFPGLDLAAARLRFRANLELGDAVPFWEDRLVADGEVPVAFRIGEVRLEGMEAWPRCAVPSRDARTGAADATFQRKFADRRQATLPAWAPRSRFDHFYRLCVGTRVPPSEAGKVLRAGDEVVLTPSR